MLQQAIVHDGLLQLIANERFDNVVEEILVLIAKINVQFVATELIVHLLFLLRRVCWPLEYPVPYFIAFDSTITGNIDAAHGSP